MLCAAGALTATAVATPSAAAADRVADYCGFIGNNGALCYRWGANNTGTSAGFRFSSNVPDLLIPTRWLFRNDGTGAGTQVANNAGSAENRSVFCVTVYYWENYNGAHPGGPNQYLVPTQKSNLGTVQNNNRSHRFQGC